MADYYCIVCGGRTSMMGHGGDHDERLTGIIDKLQEEYPGVSRARFVQVVGQWQIGEVQLPETPARD